MRHGDRVISTRRNGAFHSQVMKSCRHQTRGWLRSHWRNNHGYIAKYGDTTSERCSSRNFRSYCWPFFEKWNKAQNLKLSANMEQGNPNVFSKGYKVHYEACPASKKKLLRNQSLSRECILLFRQSTAQPKVMTPHARYLKNKNQGTAWLIRTPQYEGQNTHRLILYLKGKKQKSKQNPYKDVRRT